MITVRSPAHPPERRANEIFGETVEGVHRLVE